MPSYTITSTSPSIVPPLLIYHRHPRPTSGTDDSRHAPDLTPTANLSPPNQPIALRKGTRSPREALLKSNEVFETLKQDIEKMAKSIKELKKENAFLKGKCDKSDVTLIELAEEMRTLKWDLWFEPDVETTISVAWISMPELPPNFFAKEAIFSIASAVGKPINCRYGNKELDKTEFWHDESTCWNVHPGLYESKREADDIKDTEDKKHTEGHVDQKGDKKNNNFRGRISNEQQWLTRRNKYRRDKYGHIVGEIEEEKEEDLPESNTFAALSEDEDEGEKATTKDSMEKQENIDHRQSTKEWVNNAFGKSSETKRKSMDAQEEKVSAIDNNNNETDKVMERVLPLAIQATHQMEFSNKNKHELDDEDLEKNIDKIALEGGDFNVITSDEEKLGGLPVSVSETADFNHCINLCNLEDPDFKGSFVQGRSIAENILVVQEIVSEIRKRGKTPNMVMKLDMMKAYDRVEWLYLTKAMRKMGFGEVIIDLVYRLLSNNWYSILLNGQPKVFLSSTRGLKQDDMIILCKTNPVSESLENYEKTSGQRINKEKSAIYLHKDVSPGVVVMAEVATSILRKDFPFVYLGCPIFHMRKKKITKKIRPLGIAYVEDKPIWMLESNGRFSVRLSAWQYIRQKAEDEQGDLLYAKGAKIDDTTNTEAEAEAEAIFQAAIHCKQLQYTKEQYLQAIHGYQKEEKLTSLFYSSQQNGLAAKGKDLRREFLKRQLEKTKNQKERLEALCRSLQAERKAHSVASNDSDSI
ncbi:hypothetical protein FXO37_20085 [Capsicum annuum]|nr:hypothetical protein FXO37_20085 [Capsicum annuum]